MKRLLYQIENTAESLNNRHGTAEERRSELENETSEISQTKRKEIRKCCFQIYRMLSNNQSHMS